MDLELTALATRPELTIQVRRRPHVADPALQSAHALRSTRPRETPSLPRRLPRRSPMRLCDTIPQCGVHPGGEMDGLEVRADSPDDEGIVERRALALSRQDSLGEALPLIPPSIRSGSATSGTAEGWERERFFSRYIGEDLDQVLEQVRGLPTERRTPVMYVLAAATNSG